MRVILNIIAVFVAAFILLVGEMSTFALILVILMFIIINSPMARKVIFWLVMLIIVVILAVWWTGQDNTIENKEEIQSVE